MGKQKSAESEVLMCGWLFLFCLGLGILVWFFSPLNPKLNSGDHVLKGASVVNGDR